MKNLIIFSLLLITLFLLIGCEEYNNRREQKEMNEFIESELASNIRSDTIFLDFRFGMSEKEFNAHLSKLKRKGKIWINKNNYYEYIFDVNDRYYKWKAEATISAEFYKNKLMQLNLFVTSEDMYSNELLKMKLFLLYSEPHDKGRIFIEKSVLGDSDNYVFIENNKKIEIFDGINDARIFYTDMIAERNKKEEDKQNSIESLKKIQEDL